MRQAVAVSKDDPGVVRQLLDVMLEARDYAGVVREADALLGRDANLWWAQLARAIARRKLDDKDGAVRDFEQALASANALRSEEAAQQVVQALAREMGVDEALSRIGQRAEAETRWQIVAAQLQHAKGDYAAAAAAIEQALAAGDKLSPRERESALRVAGSIYLATRPEPPVQKAYDAYVQLLDLRPDDLMGLNNLACLLADTMDPPRPAEALKYSQRAYDQMLSTGVRDALIFDTHGWMLTLNGRAQEGIDVLRQSIAIKPFAEAYYHLAEAYLKASYPEEALRQLELARQELQAAEDAKRPVDVALKRKVDDAGVRAREAIGSKASATAAP
jgi:tetratricopeptide (TPR) repeat protein